MTNLKPYYDAAIKADEEASASWPRWMHSSLMGLSEWQTEGASAASRWTMHKLKRRKPMRCMSVCAVRR
jgi:hypothetical protein